MALLKGGIKRIATTLLYFLAFCCAAIVLGIYAYFLAVLADRSFDINNVNRAVTGISGAATLYTIFAVLLTCCLGGVAIFSIIGFILDILFAGGFIAIAVMTRSGASSCSGVVYTPIGWGDTNSESSGFDTPSADGNQNYTYQVRPYTACRLNTAAFAVSIVGIFLFLITAFAQLGLIRSHKKEKRYGPSPANGYTSGPAKQRFWQRRPANHVVAKDAELGTAGPAPHTTATAAPMTTHHNTHTGYHTQPQGTGVNPYGYDNTAPPTHTTGTATNY